MISEQVGPMIFTQVHQASTQNFTNGVSAAIAWDTIDTDPAGIWGGVSHPTRFTAPYSGLWSFSITMLWNAGSGPIALYTYVNGSYVRGIRDNTIASQAGVGLNFAWYMKLTAGDYFEAWLNQTLGSTMHPEYGFGAGTYPTLQVVFHG
jgi:hypothetical protein